MINVKISCRRNLSFLSLQIGLIAFVSALSTLLH